MTKCSHCGKDAPDGARTCPACGLAMDGAPTVVSAAEGVQATRTYLIPSSTPPATPSPPRSDDDLVPGTMVLGRYRIRGLLGRGGMGAVYRADDRKLEQEVALKFISDKVAPGDHGSSLLIHELKTARRISHPHVCRVYDIGEYAGRTFISMEYVDGEDLSTLQRRIGRVTPDKAAQIARQLCAGLNAAHERGVLHRDLKPANIMLDGDGNVRITDFGIAAGIDTLQRDPSSGTPAYMAPELFTGGQASVRSDLYSLGLVLYELFTGRVLFNARSMTELLRLHRRPVPPPREHVQDIDERVEHAILACLANDPNDRPASAMAVLAMLPGGDPLAEALASGQTPSPEQIAACGGTGAMSSRAALCLLGALAVTLLLLMWAEPRVKLFGRVALPKSGAVLADRAEEMLRRLGFPPPDGDRSHGFETDNVYLKELLAHRPTRAEWDDITARERPSLLGFWYRAAAAHEGLRPSNVKGRVTWTDPPPQRGDVQARLDPLGRLHELLAVPADEGVNPPVDATRSTPPAAATDWTPLFEAAGLDRGRFREVPSLRVPITFADERAAWVGRYPEPPHLPIRVEAAALGGRAVAFHIIEERLPQEAPAQDPPGRVRTWRFSARICLVLAAFVLAVRSFRQRRGDARGALRLGTVMFGLVVAFTALTGHYGGDPMRLFALLAAGIGHGMVVAVEFALYYFALETLVRRVWPEIMISWSRLLSGRWRDPLVGHHFAWGVLLASITALLAHLRVFLPRWVGKPEPEPIMFHDSAIVALDGVASAMGAFLEIAVDFAKSGMMFFVALVGLRLVTKRPIVAAVLSTVIWATVWTDDRNLSMAFPWLPLAWFGNAALTAAITVSAMRFGLLATVVGFVFFGAFTSFPLRPEGVWFDHAALLVLALVIATAGWGARTALRPR
jgi:serine/threonine-protein kinase